MNVLESRLEDIAENIDVAVIGCYVNGPGNLKLRILATEDAHNLCT